MQYDLIISLTTWRKRIYNREFKAVICSLLTHETNIHYKVVLVLSTDEFTERDIPKWIIELDELADNFEVLWTKENTKPYKKYFPTRRKYPDENIMIIDDDMIIKPNALSRLYYLMKTSSNKFICGSNHNQCSKIKIGHGVRYGFAIYRPNSTYQFDEIEGRKFFKNHDDEFLLLLSTLNKSHYIAVDAWDFFNINCTQQEVKLENEVEMQYTHLCDLWNTFFSAYPDLKSIYDKNKNEEN